jgi:hypothetical protein
VQYRGPPVGTITVSAGAAMFPEHGTDGERARLRLRFGGTVG